MARLTTDRVVLSIDREGDDGYIYIKLSIHDKPIAIIQTILVGDSYYVKQEGIARAITRLYMKNSNNATMETIYSWMYADEKIYHIIRECEIRIDNRARRLKHRASIAHPIVRTFRDYFEYDDTCHTLVD